MEIWKDIPGFEGKYQASTYGRIYSLIRKKIKNQRLNKDGYYRVTLTNKNGKNVTPSVHRLVALTFLPQIDGKDIVNHLDSNRKNNHIENLEWTDASGNMKHGYDYGYVKPNQKKATEASLKVITNRYQIWKDGVLVGIGLGLKETADIAKINEKTVRNCLRENRKSRQGFSFVNLGGDSRACH